MKNRYTDSELKTIRDMRENGAGWKEIARAVNRTAGAVCFKYKQTFGKKSKVKRGPYNVKMKNGAEVTLNTHRPMFALVGTHNEVTSALRELFS